MAISVYASLQTAWKMASIKNMASNAQSSLSGLHTPRLEARQQALEIAFSQGKMVDAWAKYVRPGLRNQEIIDLFDYNDFHWNKAARFSDLKNAIIQGRYKPGNAIPAKLEKSLGVCRTVVTPSPEDALVLQCIVEMILPNAIKKQPSENAFFSRSHQPAMGSFTFGRDYIWFKQWPRFTRKRFSISSVHDWVVTTDISTFFDNIHYSHLRNIISSLGEIEEVVLDVLFSVLDNVSWRPDYLPSCGIGLPQVQFDAPRLLAHVYLFEIDSFLKKETLNCFVRWVDDITFAVDSRDEGKRVLRDLDLLLQMRGVRLNSGKTQVLSAAQARRYFYQRENEHLDRIKRKIEQAIRQGSSLVSVNTRLVKSFELFVSRETYGHHDKIVKRYLGLFALMKSDAAVGFCVASLPTDPGLRDTIYRYFLAMGPSARVLNGLSAYLCGGDALDDASLCQIAKLLTDWEIAPGTTLYRSMTRLMERVADRTHIRGDPYRFIAALWLVTKYAPQARLRRYLEDNEEVWKHSEFLSRQVVASSAKFRNSAHLGWLTKKVERHSFRSALSVATAIESLKSFTSVVPGNVRLYILNGRRRDSTYSLQRFLIAVAVLSSQKLLPGPKAQLKVALLKVLRDPHYVRVITAL